MIIESNVRPILLLDFQRKGQFKSQVIAKINHENVKFK